MNHEQIIVAIDTQGEVKVSVQGHAGSGCKALTAEIEAALGETVSDEPTPEMHQRACTAQGHAARQGTGR